MVVFTTAYSEYAVASYDLQAIDYLLKPFTFDRFRQAVVKASEQLSLLQQSAGNQQQYLIFRVDYSLVKVAAADILFIEGLDNYLKIHLQGQKPLVVRMTMKAAMEKLPNRNFVRVHRSYIVALSQISMVRNKMISIGDEDIPISSSFEADFNGLYGTS